MIFGHLTRLREVVYLAFVFAALPSAIIVNCLIASERAGHGVGRA
jgi:hypothetical protein